MWSQQQTDLWTGRLHGMPLGTIERGRRFTFIGADGVVQRGFRTLGAAQRAHVTWETPAATGGGQPALERTLMIASAAVASITVALIALAAPFLR